MIDSVPMGDVWILLAYGLVAMMAWMVVLWVWHLKLANAAVVDFGWASGLALLGLFYAIKADGYGPRRFLAGAMVFVWGMRLAKHLLSDRVLGGKPEDPRYQELRDRWPGRTGIKFFIFFQFQAVLAVFLSTPFVLLAVDTEPAISSYEWGGLALWVIALWGEIAADAQLKRFKADEDNAGHVCQDGLWYYCRHPNYFFEWLVWVAYFVAALATPYGAWTVLCPLLMLYFLLRVTGIPATEAHALQSRGEEYAEYQRTTSRFIPWIKTS